jgi:hypothetical protein
VRVREQELFDRGWQVGAGERVGAGSRSERERKRSYKAREAGDLARGQLRESNSGRCNVTGGRSLATRPLIDTALHRYMTHVLNNACSQRPSMVGQLLFFLLPLVVLLLLEMTTVGVAKLSFPSHACVPDSWQRPHPCTSPVSWARPFN